MAKIIIEVSDEYIHQHVSKEAISAKLNEKDLSLIKAMRDFIAFGVIEGRLNKGVTEFRVSRDELTDDKKREIFDLNIADVLIIAGLSENKAKVSPNT